MGVECQDSAEHPRIETLEETAVAAMNPVEDTHGDRCGHLGR
jgi:hypothetical protein